MLTFLRRLFIVLLPVACFALLLLPVRELMGQEGQGAQAIGLFLAGLAALALAEGLLFRYWLLPRFGEVIGERVYGGSYLPEEDALVCMAARVRESRDAALLPELRAMVTAQKSRLRGWLELARIQQDVFDDAAAAVDTLEEAEHHVRPREDRALALVRAAQLCEHTLHDAPRARSLYERAAQRYPRTVYGRRAAEQISGAE